MYHIRVSREWYDRELERDKTEYIYEQRVEDLDLLAVIKAINGISPGSFFAKWEPGVEFGGRRYYVAGGKLYVEVEDGLEEVTLEPTEKEAKK